MAHVTDNRGTTGIHASVEFTAGEADTDNAGALAYFRRHPDRFTIKTAPKRRPRARKATS